MLRATRPWAIRTTLFAMVCSACGVVPTASEVETEESGEALSASAEVAALNLDPNSEDEKLLILTANTLSEETLVASVSRGGAGVGRTAGRNLVRARSGPSASDPADDRPFKSLVEIASVSGVGVSTLKRLRDYGRAHRDVLVAVESPRTEPPAVAFRTVHAGAAYSCGILLDGRVLCWGHNLSGKTSPPDGSFESITLSETFGCGIRTDGTIACWGLAGNGLPVVVPKGQFRSISAGRQSICGIETSGATRCWRATSSPSAPWDKDLLPPATPFATVGVGTGYACGRTEGGDIQCWGGRGDYFDTRMLPRGQFQSLSVGAFHACALKHDGAVTCWGGDNPGSATSMKQVPTGTFRAVVANKTTFASGSAASCALDARGLAHCWGYPTPPWTESNSALLGVTEDVFDTLDLGTSHACGLRQDGSAVCWGDNTYGQTSVPARLPDPPPPVAGVGPIHAEATFAAGLGYLCRLDRMGKVDCWFVTPSAGRVPSSPAFRDKYRFVSMSLSPNGVVCGVTTSGTVACDHLSYREPLYERNRPDLDWLSPITSGGTYRSISVSPNYACAVDSAGAPLCLARESRIGEETPAPGLYTNVVVAEGPNWLDDAVVSPGVYICGQRPDGSIACWGGSCDAPTGPDLQPGGIPPAETQQYCAGYANWKRADVTHTPPPLGAIRPFAVGTFRRGQETETTGRTNIRTDHYACGTDGTGSLSCWGQRTIARVETNITQLVIGTRDICGTQYNRSVYCLGTDAYARTNPPPGTFRSVHIVREFHACAVVDDSTLQCWDTRAWDVEGKARTATLVLPE